MFICQWTYQESSKGNISHIWKSQYLLCTHKEYRLVRRKRIRGPHNEQSFSLMCLFSYKSFTFWGRQLSSTLVYTNHTFNAKSGQFSCHQIKHFVEIERNVMENDTKIQIFPRVTEFVHKFWYCKGFGLSFRYEWHNSHRIISKPWIHWIVAKWMWRGS